MAVGTVIRAAMRKRPGVGGATAIGEPFATEECAKDGASSFCSFQQQIVRAKCRSQWNLASPARAKTIACAGASKAKKTLWEMIVKALAWHGKGDIRCQEVPDPKIENPGDVVIKVTACAICGSDLHIYGGIIPSMKRGDVLGHENMGEVVEVGSRVKKLKVGDRVVVPFTIACGDCFFCRNGFYSGCERTNPDRDKAAKLWGNSPLACSDIRTCWVVMQADRRNTCAFHLLMWAPLRCRIT